MPTESERIAKALEIAMQDGGIDGDHHKMWCIDQMVRALTGCPTEKRVRMDCHGAPYSYHAQGESEEYRQWVAEYSAGQDGPESYSWDEGTPP